MADEAKNDEGTETEQGNESTEAEASSKTFTQEDIDRVVKDRLARERGKYADYDELKAKAGKLDEIEAANQSELEKAQQAAEKAKTEGAQAIERANGRLIRAELLSALTAANVSKPEVLLSAIDKTGLTVNDDGSVSGVDEVVAAFVEANPEFVGKQVRKPESADQGARGDGPDQITQEQLATMKPEEIAKALQEGRLAHLL
jgi:hypothetical protein